MIGLPNENGDSHAPEPSKPVEYAKVKKITLPPGNLEALTDAFPPGAVEVVKAECDHIVIEIHRTVPIGAFSLLQMRLDEIDCVYTLGPGQTQILITRRDCVGGDLDPRKDFSEFFLKLARDFAKSVGEPPPQQIAEWADDIKNIVDDLLDDVEED